MKFVAIVVVAIIVLGAWYYWSNEAAAPTAEETSSVTTETETEDSEQSPAVDENAVTIDISGQSFEYDVKEIRVQEGNTVTINFTSTGGFHDWVVDEFDAATERVNEGGTTSVTFVADAAGTYEYYCSVGNHRAQGMVGTLIVE